MAVLLAVLATRYVKPVVAAVRSLQNELVEVGVLAEEGNPTLCRFHICMTLVVVPSCILGLWQMDICCLPQSMLAGISSSYLGIEGVTTITGGNDDGLAGEFAKRLENGAAELFQNRDIG